jgi:hypothetical protein
LISARLVLILRNFCRAQRQVIALILLTYQCLCRDEELLTAVQSNDHL